jgi:hypothetical protein
MVMAVEPMMPFFALSQSTAQDHHRTQEPSHRPKSGMTSSFEWACLQSLCKKTGTEAFFKHFYKKAGAP